MNFIVKVAETFIKYSWQILTALLIVFFVGKVLMGLSYAQRKYDGDDKDKMPDSMFVTNVGFIGLLVVGFILNCIVTYGTYINSNSSGANNIDDGGRKMLWGLMFVGLALIVLMLVGEITKNKILVTEYRHNSYSPAGALLVYGLVMAMMRGVVDKQLWFIGGVGLIVLLLYIGVNYINSYGVVGERIVKKNSGKYTVGDNQYNKTFTTFSTVSMGDVAVMEIGVPLILTIFVVTKFRPLANLGEEVESTKNEVHSAAVYVMCLLGACLMRVIANVLKWYTVEPRPGGFEMAGCSLTNNNVRCNAKLRKNLAPECYKTCSAGGKKLGCLCTGNTETKNLDLTELNKYNCVSLGSRTIYFNDAESYSKEQKNNIATAFQSMPSGHTSSAFFVCATVITFVMVYFDEFWKNKGWTIFLIISSLIYAGFVGGSRVSDGWHHWRDVGVGALLGILFGWMPIRYMTDEEVMKRWIGAT